MAHVVAERIPVVASTTLDERVAALQASVDELRARRPRPERLSGMHNPWGHAAVLANSWRFLDVCEDAAIVTAIARLIGPDIILWDSELHLDARAYLRFIAEKREGRYWPVAPLAGALAWVSLARPARPAICVTLESLARAGVSADVDCGLAAIDADAPLYVIRYMPATSHFVRDSQATANRAGMEEQPLINYTTRPLWLVSGEDRAGNDFVTGFSPVAPRWAGTRTGNI